MSNVAEDLIKFAHKIDEFDTKILGRREAVAGCQKSFEGYTAELERLHNLRSECTNQIICYEEEIKILIDRKNRELSNVSHTASTNTAWGKGDGTSCSTKYNWNN